MKRWIHNTLRKVLESRGFQVTRKPVWFQRHRDAILTPCLPLLMTLTLEEVCPLYFVVVGANDGITADCFASFLQNPRFSGIFVEPQKAMFESLQRNYANREEIFFENAAIGPRPGIAILYKLNPAYKDLYPYDHYTGIASFRRDHVTKHIPGGERIMDLVTTEEVSVITFKQLIKKHSLPRIDIIQIDTEGYDYEILKLIDFEFCRPFLLFYEHRHLSSSDNNVALELLYHNGYLLHYGEEDVVAVDKRKLVVRK